MKVKIRGERREVIIDPTDTYDLDFELATIILPALLQLHATKMGIPNSMSNKLYNLHSDERQMKLPLEFMNGIDSESEFERSKQEWNHIMDKIIWSFEQLALGDGMDFPLKDHYTSYNLYNERVREGFELFGKYFQDLWD